MTEKKDDITKQDIIDTQKQINDVFEFYKQHIKDSNEQQKQSDEQLAKVSQAILDKLGSSSSTNTVGTTETLNVLKSVDTQLSALVGQSSMTLQADTAVFTTLSIGICFFLGYIMIRPMLKHIV